MRAASLVAVLVLLVGCASAPKAARLLPGDWEDADRSLWTFGESDWTFRLRPVAAPERVSNGTWRPLSGSDTSLVVELRGHINATWEFSFTADGQQLVVMADSGNQYWHRADGG